MHKVLCLITLSVCCQLYGQIDEVRRITKELCSPEFHGRGYVNRGDSIAAEFIANEFREIGLEPVGKHSFFQSFNLNVNTFPGKMSLMQADQVLQPGIHYLVDPGSGSFNGKLVPVSISIDQVLDQEQLAQVLKNVMTSKEHNALLFNFTDVSQDTLKLINGLSEELAEYVPVIEITNKKFTWSVASNQFKHPLIQLQDSVFNKNAEYSVNIEARWIENYPSRNVIASLPSKRKRAKTIVFSAHYDHLGRMGIDTYFPGANDNASGTAMLLSMAKYFKANPVDYNLVFIAFAGEEAGLVGSKYFVNHPWLKLEKIRFLINLDIMGSGEEGITAVNATLHKSEFELLRKINEEKHLLTQVKERGPAANSDHYWFSQNGVPSFFIYTMGPNKNYHDVFDKYEALSFNEYDDITTLLVEFVRRLACVPVK